MKIPTLHQLRSACAVVDCGFNVTRAASKMCSTQSAISKTIGNLEDDLGTAIFSRTSVRITGLTDYGQELVELARGMLRDAEFAVERARAEKNGDKGVLRIATTHAHAKYSLPAVLKGFRKSYAGLTVQIQQGSANEIARLVANRQVHLGICGRPDDAFNGLVRLHAMTLNRCVAVDLEHPLLHQNDPDFEQLGKYPFIALGEFESAQTRLAAEFAGSGVCPQIVLTAADTSVLKEYVACGLGIAILHDFAIQPNDRLRLTAIDASHLFPSSEAFVLLRGGEYLRKHVYEFIHRLCPKWTRSAIDCEMEQASRSKIAVAA